VLHQMGWKLIVHPDGTSQVKSPDGTVIRSHHRNRNLSNVVMGTGGGGIVSAG
jgi:hypothetical protein